ncbi:hypothetical protein [Nocardia altamirensis]|uniref:hypothetical protein n=1 Tax=Nocardia altamirensis TaxID=472158 RepID=UPI00114CF856|nr:hypothetical protein [Nocardia altamirensis]
MTATVSFEPAAPRRQVGEVEYPAESRVQHAERRVPGNHEQRSQSGRRALRNDEPSALRHFGPNWFAAVMGTGIVANAASSKGALCFRAGCRPVGSGPAYRLGSVGISAREVCASTQSA